MDHLNFTLDDAQIIKNIFTAFQMLEHLDLDKIKIDEDIYVKLNEILARDQALFTGFFRNSNVYIDCIPDPIAPPDLNEISYYLKMLNEINESSLKEVVPIVFCNLARMQPFFDGNKRSTLFLCNLALLKKNLGMFFIKNEQYPEFQILLTKFYLHNDQSIFQWLANNCIYSKEDIEHNLINTRV